MPNERFPLILGCDIYGQNSICIDNWHTLNLKFLISANLTIRVESSTVESAIQRLTP
jgi:hypothetical protein